MPGPRVSHRRRFIYQCFIFPRVGARTRFGSVCSCLVVALVRFVCVFSSAAEAPFPSPGAGRMFISEDGLGEWRGTQRRGRTSSYFPFPTVTAGPWWEQRSLGPFLAAGQGSPGCPWRVGR